MEKINGAQLCLEPLKPIAAYQITDQLIRINQVYVVGIIGW